MRRLVIAVSTVPHLYLALTGLRDAGLSVFLLGILVWNLAPVICGAALCYSRFRAQGFAWLAATLIASCWAVWVGLLHPRGSTASLIFLFMPLWNLAVVGPGGALLATLWLRFFPPPGAPA